MEKVLNDRSVVLVFVWDSMGLFGFLETVQGFYGLALNWWKKMF